MADDVPTTNGVPTTDNAPTDHDVRRRVIIHGRVQGVFFRDSCRRQASAAEVGGWVRNRHDGSVEAVFEGPQRQVEAMVAWCWAGPPSARVDQVDEHSETLEGLTEFNVV